MDYDQGISVQAPENVDQAVADQVDKAVEDLKSGAIEVGVDERTDGPERLADARHPQRGRELPARTRTGTVGHPTGVTSRSTSIAPLFRSSTALSTWSATAWSTFSGA